MREVEANENSKCLQQLKAFREIPYHQHLFEELKEEKPNEETKMKLKALPSHLKYVFLVGDSQKPVTSNSSISEEEEETGENFVGQHKRLDLIRCHRYQSFLFYS